MSWILMGKKYELLLKSVSDLKAWQSGIYAKNFIIRDFEWCTFRQSYLSISWLRKVSDSSLLIILTGKSKSPEKLLTEKFWVVKWNLTPYYLLMSFSKAQTKEAFCSVLKSYHQPGFFWNIDVPATEPSLLAAHGEL